jgi:maltooligosyltrehalose trehalohydrolase
MAVSSLETISVTPALAFAPVGASFVSDGVSFRVWAPDHEKIRVVIGAEGFDTRYVELSRDADGYFSGRDEVGRPGDIYWYQVDGDLLPDPASRFQPSGVEGPSQVIDPHAFAWRANEWARPPLRGRVIYEVHVGTFTPEGTFTAAAARLPALVELGVNAIELMPLADFPGRWNWGYDGVMPFAPARCYGTPDELRAMIDAAHALGLAVIVDVVYNHLGPCGNVLPRFSRRYLHPERKSIWGQALNFDGDQSETVRRYFLQNACMWLDEYRVDGLRLDAVHAIADDSETHIVAEIAAVAHARGAFVIAEDERNEARILTPVESGGWGVDGHWADDFHHTVRVALTRQQEAHFRGYRGTPQEWAETLRHGWFYRGQVFPVWKRERGTPCTQLPRERFVFCISNHDQVGNRPLGDRLHESVTAAQYRAVSMLLCLAPYTPLLFMGQEWAASTCFPYFTDLPGEVGAKMRENRLNEFRHYQANYDRETLDRMPDPQAETTFRAAKLDWNERNRDPHIRVLALYRECLRLRAREPIFSSDQRGAWQVETTGTSAVALRGHDIRGDWLLVAGVNENTGVTLGADPISRSSGERRWELVLASNDPRFGGAASDLAAVGQGGATWRGVGAFLLRET